MSAALDANVIIAGLLSWHEHHRPAAAAIEAAFESGEPVVVPIPALIEVWSVMTRLPARPRLFPRGVGAAHLDVSRSVATDWAG